MAEPSGFNQLLSKNVIHIHEKLLLSLDYETFKKSRGVCKIWDELLAKQSFRKRADLVFHDEMKEEMFQYSKAEMFRYSRDGEADKLKRLLSRGLDPNCREVVNG